jgi:hypothetical protein
MLNGFGVEAMFSFPHLAVKDNKVFKVLMLEESIVKSGSVVGLYCNPWSVSAMVNQFNEFCSKLKISGKNTFTARAKLVDPTPDAGYFQKVK